MSEFNTGSGDVEITLGGNKHLLKPSLRAATTLSSQNGGLTKLMDKILNLEFDAIHSVIAAGIGSNSADLAELVYKQGLINISSDCVRFIHILANGGQPVDMSEVNEGEKVPLAIASK